MSLHKFKYSLDNSQDFGEKQILDRDIRSAMYYLRFIRRLKKILILGLCCIFVLFIIYISKGSKEKHAPLIIFEGKNITLSKAFIETYNKDNAANYAIKAATVERVAGHKATMLLEHIEGTIAFNRKTSWKFTTKKGFYHLKKASLSFLSPLFIQGLQGEDIFIKKGNLNFQKHAIKGTQFIKIKKNNMILTARNMIGSLKGKITFSDKVMLIVPAF